ncbi:MAG: Ig-like domain-containing protein [Chloroflexota bacterium]|nr:Ig-like domain-containing protein [Chloroflexota bacterium]
MKKRVLLALNCILAILMLMAVVAPAAFAAPPEAAGKSGEISIPLSRPDIGLQRADDGLCKFTAPDLYQMGETGSPAVPYRSVTVLLPPNADMSTVSARIEQPAWERIAGEFEVAPVPPAATRDGDKEVVIWPEGINIVAGKNLDIYNANTLYPTNPIAVVDTITVRHWQMAQVYYAACSYSPVEKALYQLSDGVIRIAFERDPGKPAGTAGRIIHASEIAAIQSNTANFDEAIGEYESGSTPAASSIADYVIITTSRIQSNSTELFNFVASKVARGFTVQVVTEETWGSGTGDTAAENIRSWLQSNYEALGIQYVLLIGNPNPSTGDVPMKMCYPQHYDLDWDECPTDFYFAELISDWDSDGDGKFGEYEDDFGNSPPRGAEVSVGRIPYYGEAISDLDNILAKMITYENTTEADAAWRQNVLLPMEPSDSSTPGYHLGEQIKTDVLNPNGWRYHRVYDEDYGLVPPPETYPCTVSSVTSAWNGSDFGGIFWWTHGNATYAADIMNLSSAATLDDSHPGFTFQSSCLNGHPEITNNLGYSLLKNGCVSTVSASRVSWYYEGQTTYSDSSSNSGMTYEYSSRLIDERMPAGYALNDLRLDVPVQHEVFWMNYLGFNIYGCPEIGLFSYGNDPDNNPPVANADAYSTNEDTTLTASAPGVLINDTDVDGDTLTASQDSGPSHGSLTLNGDGSFTYTPDPDFNGSDSFTYRAYDDTAYSNAATVTININPVVGPSISSIRPASGNPGDSVRISGANFGTRDASSKVYFADTEATTISLWKDGFIKAIVPDLSSGAYSLKVVTGDGESNEVTFTVISSPSNPPSITSSPITTAVAGITYTYDVEAADPDGDTLTYSLDASPLRMTIDQDTGIIFWTPDDIGDYNVMVRVTDSTGLYDTQAFTISVSAEGTNVHVEDITMTSKQAGPNKSAIATVVILSNTDAPIEGATVSGKWELIIGGTTTTVSTVSGVTGVGGTVEFQSPKTKTTDTVTFTFTVTDVSGFFYDSGANEETYDSITL